MIKDELKACGLSATTVRIALLAALRKISVPVSVGELGKKLQSQGITAGRASVFRNLDAFVTAGFAERINSDKSGSRYVACSIGHDQHHHHHIICQKCQQTKEVTVCLSKTDIRNIESLTKFNLTGHSLTLFGLCEQCSRTINHSKQLKLDT